MQEGLVCLQLQHTTPLAFYFELPSAWLSEGHVSFNSVSNHVDVV
jgi:hypothetical protein